LSIADIKYVVVTDDDIDIFDPVEVEWAIATRVQADRDTVILSNARSKPLDPSIPPSANGVPTTAKMGIDATIPENVPRYRYNRIIYHNQGKAVLDDYLVESPAAPQPPAAGDDAVERLAERTLDMLREKRLSFSELLDAFSDQAFATVMALVGRLNERKQITLDEEGKYMPAEDA
ncbi:MAG: UbiD family decarboxylase, partial [Deltaproteobacteria bacterium]|nr:UbiD family decarboxylase [Deltaproteobacteria bacterium]